MELRRDGKYLILGLEGSGKRTLLNHLQIGDVEEMEDSPDVSALRYKGIELLSWNVPPVSAARLRLPLRPCPAPAPAPAPAAACLPLRLRLRLRLQLRLRLWVLDAGERGPRLRRRDKEYVSQPPHRIPADLPADSHAPAAPPPQTSPVSASSSTPPTTASSPKPLGSSTESWRRNGRRV